MRRRLIIIASILFISTFLKVGFYFCEYFSDHSVDLISSDVLPKNGAESILLNYKIDINSAGLKDLVFLPGIGPKLAKKIVSFRAQNGLFSRVENLLKISGIGPKKLAQISHFIDVKE